MAAQDIYTVVQANNLFEVKKFDKDFNFLQQYFVTELGADSANMICTCPAGAKPTCRHRQMVRLFEAEGKLNTGEFYHFDKKKWLPALKCDTIW